jgi:large repetitive protein
LIYSSLNTIGYSNITVLWGAYRTTATNNTFTNTPTFEWSTDNATWNAVSYTDVPANSTWALVNGGVRISLPAGAAGASTLYFRWTIASKNNYRIDDFTVQGCLSPVDLELTIDAPANAECGEEVDIPVVVNSGFVDLASLQFSINWDPARFDYVMSTPNVLDGGMIIINVTQTGMGRIAYTWAAAGAGGYTINTPDFTFLTITLKGKGCSGSTDIVFSNTPLMQEVYDINFGTPNLVLNNATLTVADTKAPTGTPPVGMTGINACYIDASTPPVGTPAFDAMAAAAGYDDVCGGPVTASLTNTVVTGNNCSWTVTYTFSVSDPCMNMLPGQTIVHTGGDETAPSITTPASNSSAECQGTDSNANTAYIAWLAANGGAVASDLCGNSVTWSNNANTQMWSGTCVRTITITFTATDDCTNASTTTATFTINDTTAPSITTPASNSSAECQGTDSNANTAYIAWLAANGGAVASDLCGNSVTWSNNANTQMWSGTCVRTITITFTATDDCTNASTTTATFTINDTTAPSITTPASNSSAECQGTDSNANTAYIAWLAANGGAVASDLCGNSVTWSNNANTQMWSGTCVRTITITFTATDDCTNASTTTATFTINDTTAPSITTPASNSSAECQGTDSNANTAYIAWLAANGGAVASDLCGNSVTWSNNANTQMWSGTCVRTITITFTATDDCTNASTTTATFTINDTTAPSITTPASNSSAECQGTDSNANTAYIAWLAANGGAVASDLCGNNVTWSNNANTQMWSGTCVRTITITFTATDDCTNASTTTATFTINDTTAPSITTPASNSSAECQGTDSNANTAYIAWLAANGGAVASDLCGNNVTWSNNANTQMWSGTCVRTITITFTATDDCTNASTTTATFTINDTTAPSITTPASNSSAECQGTDSNANTAYIAWLAANGGAVASDLCGNKRNVEQQREHTDVERHLRTDNHDHVHGDGRLHQCEHDDGDVYDQ